MIDIEECPVCLSTFMLGYLDGHDCNAERENTMYEIRMDVNGGWDLLHRVTRAHPNWFIQ